MSFLADRARNEPFLSSALRRLDTLVSDVVAAGIPRTRIVLLGFSQGACLAAEFVATRPARYGGLVAFSGGLIGPPGTTLGRRRIARRHAGVLRLQRRRRPRAQGTRRGERARCWTRMGAEVIVRIYPGMGHVVNDDEITCARRIVAAVADGPKDGPAR